MWYEGQAVFIGAESEVRGGGVQNVCSVHAGQGTLYKGIAADYRLPFADAREKQESRVLICEVNNKRSLSVRRQGETDARLEVRLSGAAAEHVMSAERLE